MNDRQLTIAIATYRRPDELSRLLSQFPSQLVLADGWILEGIVIVDNDPLGSARACVEAHQERLSAQNLPIVYVIEPNPGISEARNRAIKVTGQNSSHLAFLDDDEMITAHWPAGLLEVADATGADLVGGPVLAIAEGAPEWMRRPHFLGRADRPDRSIVHELATNNILIRMGALVESGLAFDVAYGLTGGSDALLTRQLSEAGYKLRWSSTAILSEVFPPERISLGWLKRRWYRVGLLMARIENDLASSSRTTNARSMGLGVLRSLYGLVFMPLFLVSGSEVCLRRGSDGLRQYYFGRGLIDGARGKTLASYGPSGTETKDRDQP